MARLGFTLGEDIGIRLAEIARDYLIDLDIDKAKEVFTKSFGCNDHLAEKLSIGESIIIVDDSDKCTINVCKRDFLSKDRAEEYPRVSVKDLYRKIDSYFQSKRDEDNEYVFDDLRYLISTVNRYYIANNEFMIDANISKNLCRVFPSWFPNRVKFEGIICITPRTILAELLKLKDLNEDSEFFDFINEIDVLNLERYGDKNKLNKLMYVTLKCLEILRNKDNLLKAEEFCLMNFDNAEKTHKYRTERNIDTIEEVLGQWMILAKNEDNKVVNWDKTEADKLIKEYLEYIKS